MKSVLINANNDEGWNARFQGSLDVARAFGSHLEFVQAMPLIDTIGSPLWFVPYPDLANEIVDSGREHRRQVEAQLHGEGVSWEWSAITSEPSYALTERSGLADLIVVSAPGGKRGEAGSREVAVAASICTHARGPVLAVPTQLKRFDPLGTALVAWNGSLESAHAVRLSLPILAKASRVFILTVTEDEGPNFPATDASQYLARHGIASELHCWEREERKVSDVVLDAASTLGADYVVAGAYGHSRFREAVLGGVTRGLLSDAPIPVITAH
jgi:nucleotide-binding universal stress UspA family protein